MNNKKVSTDNYKGVRDFYPEDLFVQEYIFEKMSKVAENFGYEKYDASVLEYTELYKAKSGEEIVNEQTYSFVDRGGRDVTLRPEMTPTVARMVAKKRRELSYPLRLYSIPNLFRYERPQKGRLREHWQLNVDVFGIDTLDAEIETIKIGVKIMEELGAKSANFIIKINDRNLINDIYRELGLDDTQSYKLSKLIDKINKITEEDFNFAVKELLRDKFERFIEIFNNPKANEGIETLLKKLEKAGIKNAVFDISLMRGFDYYTGIVFEFFDTNPENNRSLFGGGRYDKLLDIFGVEPISTVGFGMGDVTARDFLESRDLIPKYIPATKIYICPITENKDEVEKIATKLRESGINTAVDYSDKKIRDKIKIAVKKSIPFVIIVGDNEIKSKKLKVKDLTNEKEEEMDIETLVSYFKK